MNLNLYFVSKNEHPDGLIFHLNILIFYPHIKIHERPLTWKRFQRDKFTYVGNLAPRTL